MDGKCKCKRKWNDICNVSSTHFQSTSKMFDHNLFSKGQKNIA